MQEMIVNLINGNLTDAKNQAKGFTYRQIINGGIYFGGFSRNKALKAAVYLCQPSQYTFQDYCDAK